MASELQIRVKSFDAAKVESAVKKILGIATGANAQVKGPIPLPRHRELFTVLRSTQRHKKAREQFQICTHKRLIVLNKVSEKLLDQLKHLELAAGVSVSMRQR